MAAFNDAVNSVLGKAIDVSDKRGEEYLDSWAIENLVTRFLDMALRNIGLDIHPISPEAKRLLIAGVLVDVKDSRMIGRYKDDTVLDGINYRAAYAHWTEEYLASR